MTPHQTNAHAALEPKPLPAPPSPAPASDLQRLGKSLITRAEQVLELTNARLLESEAAIDAVVQESFEQIGRSSTVAVAGWMSGEGQRSPEAGQETWLIFGELAASRAASLDQVIRRCLWWRDSMTQVLTEDATRLDIAPSIVIEARDILQLSLEFSLVRMAECFEYERAQKGGS